MLTTGDVLGIHVHLVDGATVRFVQKDPEVSRKMLTGMQPARFYKEDLIIIGDRSALTTFPTRRIGRVDFVMPNTPAMDFPLGVTQIVEITAEQYESHDRDDRTKRYVHIELNNIPDVFLEITVDAQEADDLRPMETTQFDNPATLMNRIFSSNGMCIARLGGGVAILNPTQFTRMTIHPEPDTLPPDTMPAGVWEASLMTE